MTSKTSVVQVRVEPEIKEGAEGVLDQLGLSMTDAVRIFLKQVALQKGLPFAVRMPNAVTAYAMKAADEGKGLQTFGSTEEAFKDLGL